MHNYQRHPLPRRESVSLLRSVAPMIGDQAVDVAEACRDIPLALRLSGGLIVSEPTMEIDGYLEAFARERDAVVRKPPQSSPPVAPETIAALRLNFHALGRRAQDILSCMSVFPASFDTAAILAITGCNGNQHHETQTTVVKNILSSLTLRQLLEWDEQIERYSLHPIVQTFVAERLHRPREIYLRYVIHYFKVAKHASDLCLQQDETCWPIGMTIFDRERAHIDAAWEWLTKQSPSTMTDSLLLGMTGVIAPMSRYRYDIREDRIPRVKTALCAAQRLKHPKAEIALLGALGQLYQEIGEVRRGTVYYQQRLELLMQEYHKKRPKHPVQLDELCRKTKQRLRRRTVFRMMPWRMWRSPARQVPTTHRKKTPQPGEVTAHAAGGSSPASSPLAQQSSTSLLGPTPKPFPALSPKKSPALPSSSTSSSTSSITPSPAEKPDRVAEEAEKETKTKHLRIPRGQVMATFLRWGREIVPKMYQGRAWFALALFAFAEIFTFFISPNNPFFGVATHVVLLIGMYIFASHGESETLRPAQRLALVSTIIPLNRIISIFFPWYIFEGVVEGSASYTYYFVGIATVSIFLLISFGLTLWHFRLSRHEIGLHLRNIKPQTFLVATGIIITAGVFFLIDIKPPLVLFGGIVLALMGFGAIEEMWLRGIIQTMAQPVFGRFVFLYVALLSVILQLHLQSAPLILFNSLLGIAFSYMVLKGETVIGAMILHGLANVTFFLLIPHLDGSSTIALSMIDTTRMTANVPSIGILGAIPILTVVALLTQRQVFSGAGETNKKNLHRYVDIALAPMLITGFAIFIANISKLAP